MHYITGIRDLKTILNPELLQQTGLGACEYLLIRSDKFNWKKDLQKSLANVGNEQQLLAMSISVAHDNTITAITLLCRKVELTKEFIDRLNEYIFHLPGLLKGFLEDRWKESKQAYPLVFVWYTSMDSNSTLTEYRCIAPAFRKMGIMKLASLAQVKCLQKAYGSEHELISHAIHPATYLFFNPDDKKLTHFRRGDSHVKSCGALMKAHEPVKSPLLQQSLFDQGLSPKEELKESKNQPK